MAIQIIAQNRDIVRRQALPFTPPPTLRRCQFRVLLAVTVLRAYEFGSQRNHVTLLRRNDNGRNRFVAVATIPFVNSCVEQQSQ